MNKKQLEIIKHRSGFVAALDQSGGSTPKALAAYGIADDAYKSDAEMFDIVHQMRTRIIKSPAFTSDRILAAILFERTMDSMIDDLHTADYLWKEKVIVPFLKVDSGLAEQRDGVQLMKPISGLDALLERAVERHVFGTKMRSVIKEANAAGIKQIVEQQFDIGQQIAAHGLVPILEPEVDIHSSDKSRCEHLLLEEIMAQLGKLDDTTPLMFKLTIPNENNMYAPLIDDPKVVRVVALSGGYSRIEANSKLADNANLIASFSRALVEGLSAGQSDEAFDATLSTSITSIFDASMA